MSRFRIHDVTREDATLVALTDTATGATAHVWTEVGFNLLEAHLPIETPTGHRLVDAIMGPPTLDDLRVQPTWWGTPLLWPFPGRVPGGAYAFRGEAHRFGPPDRPDHPDPHGEGAHRFDMHGFVRHLPWRVTTRHVDDTHAALTATFTSDDHPDTLLGYPFPYRLEATWTLDASGLRLDFHVANAGGGDLPFGYGAHPYLRTPLGPTGEMHDCLAVLDAREAWGGRDAASPMVPIETSHDLRDGKPVTRGAWNGIRGAVATHDGWWAGHVDDRLNGVRATVHADDRHPYCVVFVAPWGDGICFEPWTCPGDVFNLAEAGVPGHGLITLPPGETWSASMRLTVEALPTSAP